jgi:hypothetical protein
MRDDEDERHEDEHGRHSQDRTIHDGQAPAAEPEGGHDAEAGEGDPSRLLDEARDVEGSNERRDVAVHQAADDERRRDERTPSPVPQEDREDEGEESRPGDHDAQCQDDLARIGLAQVLGPEEEHGVGREEQRMQTRGRAGAHRVGVSAGDGHGPSGSAGRAARAILASREGSGGVRAIGGA